MKTVCCVETKDIMATEGSNTRYLISVVVHQYARPLGLIKVSSGLGQAVCKLFLTSKLAKLEVLFKVSCHSLTFLLLPLTSYYCHQAVYTSFNCLYRCQSVWYSISGLFIDQCVYLSVPIEQLRSNHNTGRIPRSKTYSNHRKNTAIIILFLPWLAGPVLSSCYVTT